MDNTAETKVKVKVPPFYMVVKDKGVGKRMQTKRRHLSEAEAIAEAERLSTTVGGKFFVFRLAHVRKGKKVEAPESLDSVPKPVI